MVSPSFHRLAGLVCLLIFPYTITSSHITVAVIDSPVLPSLLSVFITSYASEWDNGIKQQSKVPTSALVNSFVGKTDYNQGTVNINEAVHL